MLTENEKKVLRYMQEHKENITACDVAKAVDMPISLVDNIITNFINNEPSLAIRIPAEIELECTNKVIKIVKLTESGYNYIEEERKLND